MTFPKCNANRRAIGLTREKNKNNGQISNVETYLFSIGTSGKEESNKSISSNNGQEFFKSNSRHKHLGS